MLGQHIFSHSDKHLDFLSNGGEMEKLIRAFNWSKTTLGPLESWPTSLKHAVNLCLMSSFPTLIYAGPQLITLYNEAFIPICGNKHPPQTLGLPAKEAWSEIWPVIEPLLKEVIDNKKPLAKEDSLFLIDRKGFLEENYFTFSYIPIGLAEEKLEGIFISIIDTTERVIHTRHSQTTKALEVCKGQAKTVAEACSLTLTTLKTNEMDIPFALLYLLDGSHPQAILKATTRLEADTAVSPTVLSLEESVKPVWPLARIIQNKQPETLDISQFSALPSGRWQKAPKQALLLPLMISDQPSPFGVLIIGATPMQALDEKYRAFYQSVASHVATVLDKAHSYEQEQVERKQTESALAKSEENYRILATISPVGILHGNKEGHIFYSNQKAGEILNLPVGEAIGDAWLQLVHPDDKERVMLLWNKMLKNEESHFKAEYRYLRRDNTLVWVMGQAVPEKNHTGEIIGFISTLTDITELKELEKARAAAVQIAQEEQQRRAEEAEASRKHQLQLIDVLCHELRNPLTGIYGSVEMLTKNLATIQENIHKAEAAHELKPDLKEKLLKHTEHDKEAGENISECAYHQKVITNDMLVLAQLEAGKILLKEESVEPKKVIVGVVDSLEEDINRKNLQLFLHLPHRTRMVKSDPDRLAQVLTHLLSNAITFTPEDGKITLHLQSQEQTSDAILLQFSIADSSPGMTAEEKAQLFNPLAQIGPSSHHEYGHSRLKLTICKHLVELMGGNLEVKSEKWQGT